MGEKKLPITGLEHKTFWTTCRKAKNIHLTTSPSDHDNSNPILATYTIKLSPRPIGCVAQLQHLIPTPLPPHHQQQTTTKDERGMTSAPQPQTPTATTR